VLRSTSASAAASESRVDTEGDSRATPGCEGRRPEVARGAEGGGEENEGEGGAIAEEECPVCAVVLKVSPAEDVVRYDSCRTSTGVSCCEGPEDKDADEGGSGGREDSDAEGAGVESAN
jgi:hypothetical protein